MRTVNKVTLLGCLGKDAETKFTPSGASVANFSVATSRRWKDKQTGEWKEETDWHRVVLWRAEAISQFLTKGQKVYIEGRLQTRSYEHNGERRFQTEVISENLILLGGGKDGAGNVATVDHGAAVTDDDIPF